MPTLVSIVIPTKNRSDSLPETLDSVMAQTYPHWEAIVVDDGSRDGTEELVMAIIAKEPRVRFLKRNRRPAGASVCRNIGASAARGECVIFLDSDDLLAPWCLARRVEVLEQNPDLDFVTYLTQAFSTKPGDRPNLWNNFTEEDDLDRLLRRDTPWQTTGPLWRKNSLARIGPWDEVALSGQDWEYHVRAVAAGLQYKKVREVDSYWRKTRAGSISNKWKSARYLCNRTRLFRRLIGQLRAQKLLTKRRRRFLAGEYYLHAFHFEASWPLALKIWNAGHREGVVDSVEFWVMVAAEVAWRVSRRLSHQLAKWLIPELRVRSTFLTALPEAEEIQPRK